MHEASKIDMFNNVSKRMSEGFYWVNNWEELQKIIDMLKSGNDSLKEKRRVLIQELFMADTRACDLIKDVLKNY